MNPTRGEQISPGQYLWLNMAMTVAGGIYLWPHQVLTASGTDAPYAIGLSTLGALALARLAFFLRAPAAPAGWLARVSLAIFVVEFLAVSALSIVLFALQLNAFFLPHTPVTMMAGILVALSVWLATRSLEGLARTVQFWFPLIFLTVAIITWGVLPRAPWLSAALPASHLALGPIAHGALACWYLWISGNSYPYLAHYLRQPRKAPRWTTYALAIHGLMLYLTYALAVATYGPYAGALLKWPLVSVANLVTIPDFVVSSLGMVTVMSWTVALLLYLSVHYRVLGMEIQRQFSGHSQLQTVAVVGMGVVVLAAIVCLPWTEWSLPNLLVLALGPLDLVRIACVALPIHGWLWWRLPKQALKS